MSSLSFAIDLWDKFDEVNLRAEQGMAGVNDVMVFMQKRAELETQYAKNLSKLCRETVTKDQVLHGTLGEAWKAMLNCTEQLSINHAQISQHLQTHIIRSIESFCKDLENSRKKAVADATKSIKEHQKAHEALEKSHAAFRRYCEEHMEAERLLAAARHDGSSDKQINKLLQKEEKAQRNMTNAVQEYAAKTAAARGIDETHFTVEMPNVMESFERTEIVRTHLLKTNMLKYIQVFEDACPRDLDLLNSCKAVIESVDKDDDTQAFIGMNKSGRQPPDTIEFEEFIDGEFVTKSTPKWENKTHAIDYTSTSSAAKSASKKRVVTRFNENGRERTGWVGKQSNGLRTVYRRRYATLKDGCFSLYHDPTDPQPSTFLNMMTANVKPWPESGKCFQLICADRTYILQCQDDNDCKEWIKALQNATMFMLSSNTSKSQKRSNAELKNPLDFDLLKADALTNAVKELRAIEGNNQCADCWCTEPEWVSINLGIFICIECSGHHRNLGAHISKVRSFQLDDWDPTVMAYLEATGNERVNAIYESHKSRTRKFKPMDESLFGMRENFIPKKYVQKVMFPQRDDTDRETLGAELLQACVQGDLMAMIRLFGWGADANFCEEDGRTPLHIAAELGHELACVCLVLNQGDATIGDTTGLTPVHIAANANNAEALRVLLKNGGKADQADNEGYLPMDYALSSDATEAIEILNLALGVSADDDDEEDGGPPPPASHEGYASEDDDNEEGEAFQPDAIEEPSPPPPRERPVSSNYYSVDEDVGTDDDMNNRKSPARRPPGAGIGGPQLAMNAQLTDQLNAQLSKRASLQTSSDSPGGSPSQRPRRAPPPRPPVGEEETPAAPSRPPPAQFKATKRDPPPKPNRPRPAGPPPV